MTVQILDWTQPIALVLGDVLPYVPDDADAHERRATGDEGLVCPDQLSWCPCPTRVYDYLLGGAHNFPSDQAAAQQMLAWLPNLPDLAQANRRFLKRAVVHLLDQGIDHSFLNTL